MPKITKLRAAICIVAATVCMGAIFWEPILSAMLESYLRSYCRKCWNAELHIGGIHRVDGKWVIEKPEAVSKLPLKEGGKNLYADRILIKDNWDPFNRQVELDVAFIAPRIDIGLADKKDSKNDSASFLNISLPNFPLVAVNGRITAEHGVMTVHETSSSLPFHLEAFWDKSLSGKLVLWLKGAEEPDNRIVLSLADKDKARTIDIDCYQAPCTTLWHAFGKFWPGSADWKVVQGIVNGHMQVVAPDGVQPAISGEAQVKGLIVENPDLQLRGEIPEITLHIAEGLMEGACELTQKASVVLQRDGDLSWEVSDISGGIFFQKNNQMDVAFDGLCRQGAQTFPMHISSKSVLDSGKGVKLHVSGRGCDIAKIAPAVFREGLEDKFAQDQLSLIASIGTISSGIHLEGVVEVVDALYSGTDTIHFGCDLTAADASHEWARLSHWQDLDLDTMPMVMPALMLWQQPDAPGINVKNGWFSAQELSLDKYIGAVVLNENELQFDGSADLKGSFDQNRLSLEYDVHDFLLEHPHFTLSIDQLSDAQAAAQTAVHFIDFTTGDYHGFVPLHNASYIDKNTGLTFSGIKAQITLEPHKLHAADVETFCHGLYLAGTIDLDYSRILEGYADVSIHSHTLEGKISNLKELVSHFNFTPFVLECPFEGNIGFRQDGGHLYFAIQPQGVRIDSHIQGALSDGMLTCKDKQIGMRDLSSNFEYDYKSNALKFTDIQGSFLVGPPQHAEEYVFAGDRISLTDMVKKEAEFDVWVGDKSRDVIRLAGKTRALGEEGSGLGDNIEFLLDNSLSHFGDVHPESFQLVLRDWSHVETFRLSLAFHLNTLLQDVQRFSRTGLMFLSRGLLKGLNDLKTAEGDFTVDVQYDDKTALYTFNAKGLDVAIGGHQFKTCLLSGKKKDNAWGIDQLQLDDLSCAADLSEADGYWKVNFLGLRYGQSVLAGLQGEYFPHEHLFDAKINLLDVNLAQLHEWPALKTFVEKCRPKGDLHATGNARLQFVQERPKWRADVSLNLSLTGCEVQGIRLQDAENFTCHYVSNRGIVVENLRSSILDVQSLAPHAALHIRKADYDFAHHEIVVDLNGMTAKLTRPTQANSKDITLNGEVVVDLHEAYPQLPQDIRAVLGEWQAGGTYFLKGEWSISPDDLFAWEDKLRFKGELEGRHCQLKGYQFDALSAHIECTPKVAQVTSFHVTDRSGSAAADMIEISRDARKQWFMKTPLLTVKQFQPSLLRSLNVPEIPSDSTFVIRQLELKEFSGYLLDPLTLSANGRAYVANPPKRETPNQFMNFPTETFKKYGLEVSVLCPIAGAIDYEVKNGKVYFKKFKDMYSAGKMSRFYLPKHSSDPSYVDFAGNLHIQVRMKQYNLLFKLAELFTVTIEGTVDKPTFNLFKSSDDVADE